MLFRKFLILLDESFFAFARDNNFFYYHDKEKLFEAVEITSRSKVSPISSNSTFDNSKLMQYPNVDTSYV